MSEPAFSQRIRNIAQWLDSKVEIGSSSFDLAPGPVSQFDFELSEAAHGLTMIADDLDRALAAPTAPTEPHKALMKFYGVSDLSALVEAQAHHVEKLQAKLPRDDQPAFTRVREG